MIELYCRVHHRRRRAARASVSKLCPDCSALLEYTNRRIAACHFRDEKPTCARCAVHCFRSDRREEIRTVMRYSGPRMTLHHPYLALAHMLDRRRPTPGT